MTKLFTIQTLTYFKKIKVKHLNLWGKLSKESFFICISLFIYYLLKHYDSLTVRNLSLNNMLKKTLKKGLSL